jgi:glycosyltransferase involved in cell wall biosynthesis
MLGGIVQQNETSYRSIELDWIVLSPFTRSEDPEWIFDYLDPSRQKAKAVPATYQHDRSRQSSSASNWLDYLKHGFKGFMRASNAKRRTGVITAFPQLPLIVALLKKLTGRKKLRLVAWCFNLGRPYGGIKGKVARFCMSSVDIFVVHSRSEIEIYSKWLNLPASRFVFVPLSAEPPPSAPWRERDEEPYIVALGTANRDYALLAEAAGQLGYKTIIVAGKHATEHIKAPPCVTFKSGLSLAECHELATHSRVNVIPIADIASPSGQVTVIESMMLGVPMIATECAGTFDYINHGSDGLLVKPGDVASMVDALRQVWNDAPLRATLSANAKKAALQHFTFGAAGARLQELLDELESDGVPVRRIPESVS